MVRPYAGLVWGLGLATSLIAQDRVPGKPQGLGVGNGAPALQVQEWLAGNEVPMPRNGSHGILLLVFCAPDEEAATLLAHLDRTQEKHKDQGLHIVVMPVEGEGADPRKLAAQASDRSLRVARDKAGATARVYLGKVAGGLPRAFLVNHLGLIAWVGHPQKGLYGPLQQTLAVTRDKELLTRLRATQGLVAQAQAQRDYKTIDAVTQELIAIGARHASPWNTRFRAFRDYGKDPQRTRQIAVAALKDLAVRPDQMVYFANQCLLRDLDNTYYQQLALMALTPAAAQEPENVGLQLAYARALAGCGNIKQASAVALRVVPLLGDDAAELQRYAEQLTDTSKPQVFAKTALAAIDRAIFIKGPTRDRLMVKFRILDVGLGDTKAAHEVGARIITSMGKNNSALNNYAWDLLTEEPYKGRFNRLALLATDLMEKSGETVTYYMLDTIALARFSNGFIDEAIDYQKRAMAGGGKGDADYEQRMNMYLEARRERDKANRAQKTKKQ